MKRFIYILTVVLVALTACTKELTNSIDTMPTESDAVYPDGAYIDLQFSVPTPPTTRGAMKDTPEIDDDALYVAVFDGSGVLKQYEKADFDKVISNGIANAKYFKVRLLLKSSECRLHFIANGPTKTEVTGGMESQLLQEWTTNYPNAAYWQRIVLPEGITAYSFPAQKRIQQDGEWVNVDWVNGDEIHFYYKTKEEDGKTIYEHVSATTTGAQHLAHTVHISATDRPYYTDGDGHEVNVGDYVDARGYKILDGTGYFQSTSVTDAVESVPLVRNFARIKIKVAAEEGNFTPTSYYLMNIPDKGTIAPYSGAVGGFVPEYSVSRYERVPNPDDPYQLVSNDPMIYTLTENDTDGTGHSDLLASLTQSRYTADMPSTAKLIHTVEEVEADATVINSWTQYSVGDKNATVATTTSAFIFERGVPNKNLEPIYLLIGGTKNDLEGKPTRWFKVELTNSSGQYFKILRDFTYFLEIGQIDGSDGYETPAEAALGVSVSDVSNSIATENLTQVSDGKGTSMWVEYIDYTTTQKADAENNGEKKTILYKVFDTATGNALAAEIDGESRYTLEFSGDAIKGFITEDSDYDGVGPDGKSDWRYAKLQLAASGLSIVDGELMISGITADGQSKQNGKTLSRKVRYHVMPTQELTLEAEKLDSEKVGEETKLTITLPDGLGFSLFPLVLKIEFEKGNMNPVPAKNLDHSGAHIDLPVESGPSYFSDNNSFYFLFTVNYSDYYDRTNKTQPYNGKYELYFETTKDYSAAGSNGSNETWVSVTDKNEYFFSEPEDESDMFTDENKAVTLVEVNGGGNAYFNVSPASQTVRASATSATIYVSTNSGTSWTVSSTGMTATPNGGTGPGYVTLSFDPNTGATITRTATVTAGSTSKQVRVVHEAPAISLSATAASVSAAAGSYTISISSDVAWTASIRNNPVPDGVSLSPTSGEDGDGSIVLTYGENTAMTSRDIIVRVSSTENANLYKDFTLTQKSPYTTRTIGINSGSINGSGSYTGDYSSEVGLSFSFPNNGLDRRDDHIRLTNRNGNSLTVTANGKIITKVVISYNNNYFGNNTTSNPSGVSNANNQSTWEGSSDSVGFSFARNSNGSYRINQIEVTYKD